MVVKKDDMVFLPQLKRSITITKYQIYCSVDVGVDVHETSLEASGEGHERLLELKTDHLLIGSSLQRLLLGRMHTKLNLKH